MSRRIRVVVGEGRTAQRGLLRFVLEGEGFDVVGEATGTADLSGVIEQRQPDVVVLDDGIGATAVSMVHEVAPTAKVVLVWPAAVVPIGGDAKVEPAKILRDLGPTVTQVAAASVGLTETFVRPEWIDRVRKDPATLRDKLGGSGKETVQRPSVTSLQRRGRRLHPTRRRARTTDQDRRDAAAAAAVVMLPVGAEGSALEPVIDIGGGASSGAGVAGGAVEERSEWNRRLGTLALSGAAAVSALALALALGGGRIPATVVAGGGILPVGVPGVVRSGSANVGPFGVGALGGDHYDPTAVDEPGGPDQGSGFGVDGGLGGGLSAPGSSGGVDEPPPGPDDGGTGDGGTGSGGDGGTGGGGDGGTGGGGDGGGGDGGTGGGGDGDTGGGGGDGGGGGGDEDDDDDDRDHDHDDDDDDGDHGDDGHDGDDDGHGDDGDDDGHGDDHGDDGHGDDDGDDGHGDDDGDHGDDGHDGDDDGHGDGDGHGDDHGAIPGHRAKHDKPKHAHKH